MSVVGDLLQPSVKNPIGKTKVVKHLWVTVNILWLGCQINIYLSKISILIRSGLSLGTLFWTPPFVGLEIIKLSPSCFQSFDVKIEFSINFILGGACVHLNWAFWKQ